MIKSPVVIITARMKSTRLPLKVLRLIDNQTLLDHLIIRLKRAKLPKKLILATSTDPQDDILVDYSQKHSIDHFRGHPEDVLDRVYQAAKKHHADFVVSLTADCPLVSTKYIDKTIKIFYQNNADFISATNLPVGIFSYGVKVAAIKRALKLKKSTDTEIWGRYFTKANGFKIAKAPVRKRYRRQDIRLTVDYFEDLELIRNIFHELTPRFDHFDLPQIIKLFETKPELLEINAHRQKDYLKHINSQLRKLKD